MRKKEKQQQQQNNKPGTHENPNPAAISSKSEPVTTSLVGSQL